MAATPTTDQHRLASSTVQSLRPIPPRLQRRWLLCLALTFSSTTTRRADSCPSASCLQRFRLYRPSERSQFGVYEYCRFPFVARYGRFAIPPSAGAEKRPARQPACLTFSRRRSHPSTATAAATAAAATTAFEPRLALLLTSPLHHRLGPCANTLVNELPNFYAP